MTRPHLIGISGYAQSGKDTIAGILADYGYQRLAFADIIRDALYALNPVVSYNNRLIRVADEVDCGGWDFAKQRPETRRLLQHMGSEVIDRFGGRKNLIRYTMKQIESGSRYVISDVRFPDEARSIQSTGGIIWRVYRGLAARPVNDHKSERSMDGYPVDEYIGNARSIDLLRLTIDKLMHEFGDE